MATLGLFPVSVIAERLTVSVDPVPESGKQMVDTHPFCYLHRNPKQG